MPYYTILWHIMPYYAILCSTLLPTGLSSSAALCQRSFLGGAVGQRGWFPDDAIAKCTAAQIQHRSDHSVTTRDAASGLPTAGCRRLPHIRIPQPAGTFLNRQTLDQASPKDTGDPGIFYSFY